MRDVAYVLFLTAGVVAVVFLLMAVAWFLLRRYYRLGTPADERHHARTADGWDLALYRYRPSQRIRDREPVILCHGMLSNRFNVDLDERASLARYLREKGFDAWVMELRGHGGSRRLRSEPGKAFDWTFDDYILRDVAAAIATVRRLTGARRVHWFGHSMGGMVLYAACAVPGVRECIQSAVLSDAPATFGPLQRGGVRLGRLYARIFPAVPPALVLPLLGPVVWLMPHLMRSRYGLGERRLLMSLLANAIIDWGSSGVLSQFCDMIESGRFVSADGKIDYEQGARRVNFPLLILSSVRKKMREDAVRAGLDLAETVRKRYIQFGRTNGYCTDYTHSNLLLAPSSPREVFPEIADWFTSNSSG